MGILGCYEAGVNPAAANLNINANVIFRARIYFYFILICTLVLFLVEEIGIFILEACLRATVEELGLFRIYAYWDFKINTL